MTIGFSPFPHLLVPLEVTTLAGDVTSVQYSRHCDTIFRVQRFNSVPSFASDSFYSAFISTFARFSHLESLAFTHVYIPPTSLTILSSFPNLQSLVLHHCYYPGSSDKPIPELDELRTLSLRDLIFHDKPNFEGLLLSPKLSEVSIDDTSSDAIVVGKQLSSSIRRLQVFRARYPDAEKVHPDDVREVTSWIVYTSPLIEFVLTEFGLGSFFHGADRPPLIGSLKYYVGPSLTSPLLGMGCKNLTTLELSDQNSDPNHIKSIITTFPNLSCLSLAANKDFLHNLSVISPLPSLEKLNLIYTGFTPPVSMCVDATVGDL